MKSIGLIGGMSWESTLLYYQTINREVALRRGGLNSARIQMASLNFEDVVSRQRSGDWGTLERMLAEAARGLEAAGADCVLICTNTMHRVADAVQSEVSIPLLHIVDATAQALCAASVSRVALLGTRYTMEQPFYAEHMARHGIECIAPDAAGRAEVHRVIFDELCKGAVREVSRRLLQAIVVDLQARGAQGVVLGCTELCMLLGPEDLSLPVFDSTRLHALAAVDFALDTPSLAADPLGILHPA